jgi:hypothetical protein
MEHFPPSRSVKNDRKSGKLNLQARRSEPEAKLSRMFSTGPHATLEGDPAAAASKRTERGARIAGDVRRAVLFTLVLVTVGVILAEFLKQIL